MRETLSPSKRRPPVELVTFWFQRRLRLDGSPAGDNGVGGWSMMSDWSPGVLIWWISLSAISAVNIAAWFATAAAVTRQRGDGEQRLQLTLSALFVFVCAFRSFLPRAEGQRICMLDSWISSAAVARSAATVAELALVAQWTLVLRALARRH